MGAVHFVAITRRFRCFFFAAVPGVRGRSVHSTPVRCAARRSARADVPSDSAAAAVRLALESADVSGVDDVGDVCLVGEPAPFERDGRVWIRVGHRVVPTETWPYRESTAPEVADADAVPLVAYHDWGNRGPSTMRVWIPTS